MYIYKYFFCGGGCFHIQSIAQWVPFAYFRYSVIVLYAWFILEFSLLQTLES